MKWGIALLVFLAVFTLYIDMAQAEDEAIFVTGYVTGYEEGRSITLSNGEDSMSFQITEDTIMVGEVQDGATVEVEANGGHAVYIEVTGIIEEDSEPEEEESEE